MTDISNHRFLESLYAVCKSLGLVKSQYEFSKLCGRKRTWFSANKSIDRPISTAAAAILSMRLAEHAKQGLQGAEKRDAERLSEVLLKIIRDRAMQEF